MSSRDNMSRGGRPHSNNRGNNRGRGGHNSRGRGGHSNNRRDDRGYQQHIKKEQPPPAVFFVFDGVEVSGRYGNVNLKSVQIEDLSNEDRMKIINDAKLIIKNFSKPEDESSN